MTLVPPTEESAVRALLARLFDAWRRGDGAGYASCFCEGSDYITFNGIHLRGRSENAELHSALFRGVLKGTTISADIEVIDLLAPNVALLLTAGRGRKKSFQTYILVKRDGEWLIRSFQNTRVRPFSAWMTRKSIKRGSR
jgi:uncharacterized protein (TIGR02246 family)